jgi:hypothetical protein
MPSFFFRSVPPRFGFAEVGSAEDTEEEMRTFWAAAPAIASGLGFTYEMDPTPSVLLRDPQTRPVRPGE